MPLFRARIETHVIDLQDAREELDELEAGLLRAELEGLREHGLSTANADRVDAAEAALFGPQPQIEPNLSAEEVIGRLVQSIQLMDPDYRRTVVEEVASRDADGEYDCRRNVRYDAADGRED